MPLCLTQVSSQLSSHCIGAVLPQVVVQRFPCSRYQHTCLLRLLDPMLQLAAQDPFKFWLCSLGMVAARAVVYVEDIEYSRFNCLHYMQRQASLLE